MTTRVICGSLHGAWDDYGRYCIVCHPPTPDHHDAEIARLKADWSSLRGENDALRDACRAQIDAGAAGRVAALYQRAIAAESDLARLKAEVERLTAGQHRCEWCAETFPLVPRQMSEPAVDRGVCPQCKVERFRRDLAAHKRAAAAGPAALREGAPSLWSGEAAAREVERAQAEAMKEGT